MKFLQHMHPFLQAQNISYQIIVVEQANTAKFNKGKLFNVAFAEASKIEKNLSCIVFHDLDLLPIDGRNLYACLGNNFRHMSSSIDYFRYNLLYQGLVGGAIIMPSSIFKWVNGFSNRYTGRLCIFSYFVALSNLLIP